MPVQDGPGFRSVKEHGHPASRPRHPAGQRRPDGEKHDLVGIRAVEPTRVPNITPCECTGAAGVLPQARPGHYRYNHPFEVIRPDSRSTDCAAPAVKGSSRNQVSPLGGAARADALP